MSSQIYIYMIRRLERICDYFLSSFIHQICGEYNLKIYIPLWLLFPNKIYLYAFEFFFYLNFLLYLFISKEKQNNSKR